MASSPQANSGTSNAPQVDIQLSFDRATHSYSQLEPPKITLTVTSRAEHPITLFTWRKHFDPQGALTSNGYIITDKTTGELVETTYFLTNRWPQLRVRGDYDEQYFLTLPRNTPVELSTGFSRGGGGVKPDPRSVVKRGWERDEHGNERKIRRSTQATGVDGLEPGHRYTVGPNMEGLNDSWWAPVTKDEILVDHKGEGSYLQDYPWNTEKPLNFHITEAVLDVLE